MRHYTRSIGFLAALLPLMAAAGSLRVGPTRLDLSLAHPIALLLVQNAGDTRSLVQLDAFDWDQHSHADNLVPTRELIASPMVLDLAPGAQRTVRVGLREPNRDPIEHSYRLYVREVSPSIDVGSGLRFAVRIGVPVFAAAGGPEPDHAREPLLVWSWASFDRNCAQVQLENSAPHHERVLRAQLLNSAGEALWQSSEPQYVLAGARRPLATQVCDVQGNQTLALRVVTDERTIIVPAAVGAGAFAASAP